MLGYKRNYDTQVVEWSFTILNYHHHKTRNLITTFHNNIFHDSFYDSNKTTAIKKMCLHNI